MIDQEEPSGVVVNSGDTAPSSVLLRFCEPTRPFPEYDDDPVLDFLARARGERVSVDVSVRTFRGDGLDTFLDELAEDFRGWEGARTWRSLEHELTLSAVHGPGGYVRLTWGLHSRPPAEEWCFETTTVHAAGEDMRNLAAEIRTFLQGAA
ncbi:DUF6228 family protein [Streptomyces syringium]|uniref:DUF6228 family protein n=1 Tax=Streptomyces syringium TaxID=76729 RepID=UPI003D90431A